jgi:hypothetical protein
MCSRGIQCRATGQRVPSLLSDIGQVHCLDPVHHAAPAPHVLAFHPGGRPCRSSPAWSRQSPRSPACPAAAGGGSERLSPGRLPRTRRTSLIAASVSQDARSSSRCVRSRMRSPACWAIVYPFRFGNSLTSADTYLLTCCHVSGRAKYGLSPLSAQPVLRRLPSPYPGNSSRLRFICPHKHMIARRLRSRDTNPRISPGQVANGCGLTR